MKQSKSRASISRGGPPRNKKGGARGREVAVAITHPPQINGTNIRHSMRIRFLASATLSNQNITFQNLLDTYLVASTAVAGFQLFQAVKIRAVEVWGQTIVGGSAAVSVEFSGATAGSIGDQLIHSDTSMGIQPAHVLARPSARSLAADYQVSANVIAFLLSCPTGSVVDVELSFRGQFTAAIALANALVGATPGALYLRGLDGLATAASQLAPELKLYQQ